MMQKINARLFLFGVVSLALLNGSICFGQQVGKPRTLFAADYEKKIAAVVNMDNTVALQLPIQAIHDAQPLANGNWLLQTTFTEVVEVDSKGKEVWKYKPSGESGKVEIHAFRRLENGLTMIAESGTTRIIEVNKEGAIVHSTPIKVSIPNPHRDTRLVRITPTGTYLVAHEGEKCIREYDREGTVVWEYAVGSQLYSAIRLSNGNTLVGTGDGHRVIEVTKDKKTVWEINESDLEGVKLAWVTMVDRLPNGNTWIVNCHAGPNNPQILEVTPDKKVVWSFKDFKRFGNALPVAIAIP